MSALRSNIVLNRVTLLLSVISLVSLASAKRFTRSGFYSTPNTQYIQPLNNGYYSSQPGYEFVGSTPSPPIKPIYEPHVPITPVYHQSTISTTPLPILSTPSTPYNEDYDNYISITESTRPKYFGTNQFTNQASYVNPVVDPVVVNPHINSQIASFSSPGHSGFGSNSYPGYNLNRYVPHYAGNAAAYNGIYNYAPAFYKYQYAVKAPEYGVDFGHHEARQGDVTQGSYHVLLPDGRLQIVEYTADSTGYHPRIRYVHVGAAGLNGYY
nr:uncharacterized protein LOC111418589 isoform X1 [Onthophagus taurus]